MQQKSYLSVWRVVCCLLVWLSLSPLIVFADAERVARIGFAARLTDMLAQSAQHGAELAIEEANQQSAKMHAPIHFELLPQNDSSNPHLAAFVAGYFINAKVSGVVGHWSTDTAMAVAATYERAGIAQVNFTSTTSQLNQFGYQTSFRVVGSTADLAQAFAATALDMLHGERVVLIGNDSAYSKALSDGFVSEMTAHGKQVRQRTTVSAQTSDFNAALQAALDAQADVIVFSSYVAQAPDFMKAVQRMGVKANIVLNYGATNYHFAAEDNGHLYTIEPDIAQPQRPEWKAFEQKFHARYGRAPSTYSRQAYHATAMLIKAIRQADSTDPARVTQVLHQLHYTGLGCEITFDLSGNNAHPSYTLFHAEQKNWKAIKFLPDSSCFNMH